MQCLYCDKKTFILNIKSIEDETRILKNSIGQSIKIVFDTIDDLTIYGISENPMKFKRVTNSDILRNLQERIPLKKKKFIDVKESEFKQWKNIEEYGEIKRIHK